MAENAAPAGGLKGWAGWAAAKSGGAKGPKPAGVHPAGPKKKAGPPAPGTAGDAKGGDQEPKDGGDENDLALDTMDEQVEALEKKFKDGQGAQLLNEIKSKVNELRALHASGDDEEEDDEGDEPGEGDDDEPSPDADDDE